MTFKYPDENGNLVEGDAVGFHAALKRVLKEGVKSKPKEQTPKNISGADALRKLRKELGYSVIPESQTGEDKLRRVVSEEVTKALQAQNSSSVQQGPKADTICQSAHGAPVFQRMKFVKP